MHNLKNVDVTIPRDQLVVVTGVSGSGKSSLAFDTIYAEGQRRYMESFSAYVRQFIGNIERPDVEKIDGLSPVISIEQKTVSKNPRSTVGTITEIYDFMRVLFARAGVAYSYNTGKPMVKFTEDQIIDSVLKDFEGKKIVLLAPLIRSRKGHYRELFERLRKQGFIKVRVDGEIIDIEADMEVDRYKIHDIEMVVDRLEVKEDDTRLRQSIGSAMKEGDGVMMIQIHGEKDVRYFSRNYMCLDSGIAYDIPQPNSFSFNSPYGYCRTCEGLGFVKEVDEDLIIPDKTKAINEGGIIPLGTFKPDNVTFQQINSILKSFDLNMSKPIKDIPEEVMEIILNGTGNGSVKVSMETGGSPIKMDLRFEGIKNMVHRHHETTKSESVKKWAEEFMQVNDCPSCKGARLKESSLNFRIDGKNIADLASMSLSTLSNWFVDLESRLTDQQNKIAKDALKEIRNRLVFLLDVGLGYLSLHRATKTLSGGESQRIRLATQIGSQLTGVLYILDEPTIGLHQRDNDRLITSLKALRDIGNSVIVVEHDKDLMLNADHIVDIGPNAGKYGGEILASETKDSFLKGSTLTAKYLNGGVEIEIPKERRVGTGEVIKLIGASGNNLKNVNAEFPLGKLIGVSGVSGSGKSTLINRTLYPVLSRHFYNSKKKAMPHITVDGLKHIDKVIEIDQSPIGRTPRSNPVTYVGVFSDIRKLFAQVSEAKVRGYKIGRFSFNVKGGRCDECEGAGMKVIEMNFLPDVHVECEVCNGKRFNRETLEVRYKHKSISDVLEMTINEAVEFFEAIPNIYRKLKTIQDVGLGYITLGQSSTTLSGGEAQRVKLATELSKKDTGNTLYILDEPTTGLHFQDVKVLLGVLQKLVDKGNTIIVIEHNLDIIKSCDHVIDLGPEGGDAGGEIVAVGTPEEIIKVKESITGQYLAKEI
jgi:excinuclease ABC subunit A